MIAKLAPTVTQLFRNPKRWLKGAMYRDRDNRDRACFCLLGAVEHVFPEGERKCAQDRLVAAIKKLFGGRGQRDIIGFNDDPRTTHADVLRVAKEAGV